MLRAAQPGRRLSGRDRRVRGGKWSDRSSAPARGGSRSWNVSERINTLAGIGVPRFISRIVLVMVREMEDTDGFPPPFWRAFIAMLRLRIGPAAIVAACRIVEQRQIRLQLAEAPAPFLGR